MVELLQPSPELIFFIFFKKYIYLQVLCVLCLLRIYANSLQFDWLAVGSLLFGIIALFSLFGFKFLGIYEGNLIYFRNQWVNWQSGAGMLLISSLPLLLSSFRPSNLWGWLDLVHGIMLGILAVLYWITAVLD